jgi:hypothetical protein
VMGTPRSGGPFLRLIYRISGNGRGVLCDLGLRDLGVVEKVSSANRQQKNREKTTFLLTLYWKSEKWRNIQQGNNGTLFMIKKLLLAGLASVALCVAVNAQTIDGTLDASYGSALSVQGNPTGFGDSTIGDGTSAGGSELDAGYGYISGGNLNIFLAGNVESQTSSGGSANHWNVFISTGAPGQSTLNISPSTSAAMNGSQFSPGFQGVMMLDANDFQGTLFVDRVDLTTTPGTSTFLGGIPLTGGIGNANFGGIGIGLNNTNAGGITGASAAGATSVNTGLELSIPLSLLGNPLGSIQVLAGVNGGGDNFLSNQFLAGLPPGSANVGTPAGPFSGPSSGAFNFSGTQGEFFTVPAAAVPEPATVLLIGPALLGGMFFVRRRRA